MFYAPLRYLCGENKLSAFIAKICFDNNINEHYIEPYSGGASVALLASNSLFKTHPSLIVYLRKDNNTNLPYAVGEFHYTFLTFVFIIPMSKGDTKNFTDKIDFDKFWEYFKHYRMTRS